MQIPKITRKILILMSGVAIIISMLALAYGVYDYLQTYHVQRIRATQTKQFSSQSKEQSVQDLAIILQKKVIRCLLLFTFIVFLSSIIISKAYTGNKNTLWLLAIFFSLLLVFDIVAIWYFEVRSAGLQAQTNVVKTDDDVEKFFTIHKEQNPHIYQLTPVYRVPIGFLWYAITIDEKIQGDIGDVNLYSYAWLTYDFVDDKDLKGSFIPMNSIKEKKWAYSMLDTQNNKSVANWQESIGIHADFDYKKYPFDQQRVVITFEHEQYLKNIMLIPDFASYQVATTPYPAIDKNIRLSGWTITNAYFFYSLSNFQADFGIKDYWQTKNYPFLSYVIQIQRNFVESLIITLLPIIIILFIIFAGLLVLSKVANPKETVNGILALLSSLFFANLLSYQTLQRAMMSPSITYFKTFYIAMYVIIFIAATNCLFYAYKPNFFISYNNNFFPRLLYWPMVMAIFFVITLIFF